MAAAMTAVSAMSMTSTFAAEIAPATGDIPTDVTYDNRDVATEGDPDQAEWGVAVPSKIQFTDDNKTADVSVELVGFNGYTLKDLYDADSTFEAAVSVISKNNMKLVMDGTDKDETAYKLNYEGGDLTKDIKKNNGAGSDEKTEIAKLSVIKAGTAGSETYTGEKQEGTAKLTGTSKKLGTHTDTLIFSVAKSVNP